MAKKQIRIIHKHSREILAQGPIGWGITPFEGNYYIRDDYLKTDRLQNSAIPGFCPYKFFYIWLHYQPEDHESERMLGWRYILPNPLFPFIWFRVALPGNHPSLKIEDA